MMCCTLSVCDGLFALGVTGRLCSVSVTLPGYFLCYFLNRSGPSCSKHRKLNKLISGQNFNCSSTYDA